MLFSLHNIIEKSKGAVLSSMKTFEYTIGDPHGIHARPAGILVTCAKKFASDITVSKDDRSVDAKRLLAVMSLGGKCGEKLIFTVSGSDEDTAAEQLERCCRENIG